jgi:hypothetical protein
LIFPVPGVKGEVDRANDAVKGWSAFREIYKQGGLRGVKRAVVVGERSL